MCPRPRNRTARGYARRDGEKAASSARKEAKRNEERVLEVQPRASRRSELITRHYQQ